MLSWKWSMFQPKPKMEVAPVSRARLTAAGMTSLRNSSGWTSEPTTTPTSSMAKPIG